MRWGRFVGKLPIPYTGLGFPEFADYGSGRGVEQLAGMLSPLGVGADSGLVLDQGTAPEMAVRAWPGISGAAVFCQGMLAAMVVKDDRAFGNRRLHAIPASVLAVEPGFAGLLADDAAAAPVLEAVELAGFLQPPVAGASARTPGSLLASAVEAVEFTGRGQELAELTAWRDGGQRLSVMLVTGDGGQGKTRLCRKFTAQSREAGWAGGFLANRMAAGTGKDDHRQPALELALRLREATRPAMVAVDYAETRPEEIRTLIDVLADAVLANPVRILLLSRAAGAWWDNLVETLGPQAARPISLPPLTEVGQSRQDAYAAAATGLARHLAALPDSPIGQPQGQSWTALAAKLAANPPGLNDPRLGNALSLQIAAMVSLLAAATGQPPATFGEADLVRHERGYLRRAAVKRRLFDPGVLSARTDDDDRAAEAWSMLERALSGAILLGPCSSDRARAIGSLASQTCVDDVVSWLAALYPAPVGETGVGTVQPDRLAEILLGPILIRQPDLLSRIGALVKTDDDGYQVLFTLVRTAAYPDFAPIGEQAADLISTQPVPFASAAPVLAATLPQPDLLREGLVRLGQRNPQVFRESILIALDRLPEFSVSGAAFSAALTMRVAETLSILARDYPDTYLPDLASTLNNLSVRLADAGQQQEAALAASANAVSIRRQLAAANPDAHLPDLAMALHNLGSRLAEVGQSEAALAVGQESAQAYRQLAKANPDAHLPDLARSLSNLGVLLAGVGQEKAALVAAQESAQAYRQLANTNPDANLPNLGTALQNLGNHLSHAGQPEAALAAARDAVAIWRQLAAADPDAYLPGLAISLHNLGVQLAHVGREEVALVAVGEAVSIRRQLAEANSAAYLSDLATSLHNLSNLLVEAGQGEAALAAAEESAQIFRQLAEANPVYLSDLARSVSTLGVCLVEAEQQEAALVAVGEAVSIRRQLAEANPAAHLSDLARSESNLSKLLAEAGHGEAALAAAQQSTQAYRQLTKANPSAYLHDLAKSLSTLSARLGDTGREPEVSQAWELAMRVLPDESSRLALLVAQAGYLLGRLESGHGVELLVKVLATTGLHGPTEAEARRLLRRHWRKHPGEVKGVWRVTLGLPMPEWIYLKDDHVSTMMGWLDTTTWAESRRYFTDHASELLDQTASTALDEIALTALAELVNQHRGLLAAIREQGPDAVYQPLLLGDTARQWIAISDWDASRAFVDDHPELLDENIQALFAKLVGQSPGPAERIRQALLTLARSPAGTTGAYRALHDPTALRTAISAAIAAGDANRIRACAHIEALVYHRTLAGPLHLVTAWLLDHPGSQLPEGWADRLQTLAVEADSAERETALAEFAAELATIPVDNATTDELLRVLNLPRRENSPH